ncbi:MAG: acetyl-CoA C-acetyltransferase [Planctomycetota bacterium]
MSLREAVVTHALRTPIARFLGSFVPLSAVELGTAVVRAVTGRAGLGPGDVGEVLMGQARQLGSGPNPARQVAIRAGLGEGTVATTLNKACGSSLKAVQLAAQAVMLGEHDVVVAGGMESMTNIPFLLPDMRLGYRLGHAKVLDGNYQDGFHCPLSDGPMGMTAENLADRYEIGREEQDAYALRSFHRWQAAEDAGRFADERITVEVPGRKGAVTEVTADEHGRRDLKAADLAKLPPVFRPDGGTVHAGNSSGITDGAAAMVITSREEAERRGWPVLATIGAATTAGVAPEIMGIGPVPAVRALCEREGVALGDFDLIELNEAFAAQVIACDRELGLDPDRVNVNGGAIALGHPIGATGARIVVTLLHEMARRDARLGMATLCMSGGMGMAVSFRR